jgi:hypothetical protein
MPSNDTATIFHLADSLPVASPPSTTIWDAAGVYGRSSELVRNPLSEALAEQLPLVGNPWFQILILVVLVLYCLMIYFYRAQVRLCLKEVFTLKAKNRFAAEHGNLYNSFIALALVLCALTGGIALTKSIAAWADPVAIARVPQWTVPLVSIVMWAVVMTVQWGLLKAAGNFTFSGKFTGTITEIKNAHMAAVAVIVTPAVLLCSGVNPVWDGVMLWLMAAEAAVLVISFILRTFLLFVGQKVSRLVWILYLCAVEIFPIALVWTLAAKNF